MLLHINRAVDFNRENMQKHMERELDSKLDLDYMC